MSDDEEQVYMCVYIQAILCATGECSRCKTCENNPETYIKDEKLLKEFKDHPWAPYCLTCGEFDAIVNHPGHVIATGFEEYRQKIPDMIMNRILRRNDET